VDKRQTAALTALGICAGVELGIGRIVLPVIRRRWGSSLVLSGLEAVESLTIALLIGGAFVFVIWLAWSEATDGVDQPGLRTTVYALLFLLGLAATASQLWPYVAWLDLARHVLAAVTVVAIAADALIYGVALARATVGIASVALLCATLYRGISVYIPTEGSTRWLAAAAEMACLLLPWALVVTVTRRREVDLTAAAGGLVALLLSVVVMWGMTPSVRLIVAQAVGFRFSLPPIIHVLTIGIFVFFELQALRSQTIPPQVPRAYLWLGACGIQMAQPYVQFGSLVALAVLAWTPHLMLPSNLERALRRKAAIASQPSAADLGP